MADYTFLVFRFDGRCRAKEVKIETIDVVDVTCEGAMEKRKELEKKYPSYGYRIEMHGTWVTRKNLLSGLEYTERFDTPVHCSPASESYWSM